MKSRKKFGLADFDYKITNKFYGEIRSFDRIIMNKHFNTVNDMLNFHEENGGILGDSSDNWTYGGVGEQKTHELVENGDCLDKLADMVEEIREELALEGLDGFNFNSKACRRQRRFAEDGDEVDIDRYLSDDIQMWSEIKRNKKKEFIRIAINFGMNSDADLEDFARNTALAYCTTEILENLGYSVEIIGTANSQSCVSESYLKNVYDDFTIGVPNNLDIIAGKSESSISVTIKAFEDALDLRALGMTALSGMFRKYAFQIRRVLYGQPYGSTCEPTEEFNELISSNLNIGRCNTTNATEQVQHISKVIKDLTS